MGLSSDILSQFAKLTKTEKDRNKESVVYGTIVINGNGQYVKIDGSEMLTPMISTILVRDGERVTVMIKNHTAVVTGNITNPGAGKADVQEAGGEAAKVATNYIYYDKTDGLQIGDNTGGVWRGFRTHITSSAFNILNSTGETLASYGAKLIELGKNATDAVIKFCGGRAKMGVITYLEDGDVFEFATDLPMELTTRDVDNTRISMGSYVAPEGEVEDEGAAGSTMMNYDVYANCSSHASYDKDVVTGEPYGQASCGMSASLAFYDEDLYEDGYLSKFATMGVMVDERDSLAHISADEMAVNVDKMTVNGTMTVVGNMYPRSSVYLSNGKAIYGNNKSGTARPICYINSSDQLIIGSIATSSAHAGNTILNAPNGEIVASHIFRAKKNAYIEGNAVLSNNKFVYGVDTNGTTHIVAGLNASNNLYIGSGKAANAHAGHTNICAMNGNMYLHNKNDSILFDYVDGNESITSFFRPGKTNVVSLGSPSHKWYRLYQYVETISTSDEREKYDIIPISELPVPFRSGGQNTLEMLFDRLVPKVYQLNGEKADSIHIGFIAQDISASLEEIGMSEEDLGLINHEYWTDEETGEEKDEYGLAYGEFIALNTHMIQKLRKENEDLKARLAKIESLLNITS